MWAADGKSVYFVSEMFANAARPTANIVQEAVDGKSTPVQLTAHTDDSVRRARISFNGEWIVYECGADLWVVSTKGGSPRKLAIEVHADDKTNTERIVTLTQGASEFALAPNEKHIAFVAHGQIFLIPTSGGKARLLTEGMFNNHGVAWSPKGDKLIFASDRNGFDDLYLLEPDDAYHKELVEAHRFKVTQLTKTPEAESSAGFSPDGERVAFLRAGQLWTMTPTGADQKAIVKDVQVFDYDWSPDSKYLVFARRDGSFANDLYITPAAGGAARNITRYATYNAGVTWSLRGKKIAFISERRRNEPSLFVLSLQRPAAAGAGLYSGIDWDDIYLRVEQPVPMHVEEGAISADGARVAFRAVSQGGEDLWVASTDGSRVSRVTTGNQRPQQITWSRYMSDLIYFRDGRGAIRTARAGGSGSSSFAAALSSLTSGEGRIPFMAKLTIRREEEFKEMFEQSWRGLAEEFFDPRYNGIDWAAMRIKYEPLVKHVALKEDFYSLVSLMLGELNASHLGITGTMPAPDEPTADLGLLFDESYHGPGLKIAEVLKRGPADKRGIRVKPGEIVLSIDGVQVLEKSNVSKMLNGKVGEPVTLEVSLHPADPGTRHRVEIQAAGRDTIHELMYDRWVENNAHRVAELSHGKLGYIHIPSMDEAGLDRFVRGLYSDNFDKEAIVLDIRYNGGGFTHDQVLNYLGGRIHTSFRMRDGGQGTVMRSFDRKWTKPLVLLINNRSYSDAEIFPSAFRTLGLGKLVGEPTGAHVLGVYSIRLIDGSRFRIPRVGVFTASGASMEKEGVKPDVPVEQQPDQLAQGIDAQIDRAVAVLEQEVVAWKKSHPELARKPDEKSTAAVPASSK
jgi:tricorn protease